MKFINVFAVGLLTSSVALAQNQPNNEILGNLIRESINYYPQLKQQRQAASISQSNTQLAEANRKPEVSGDATYQFIWPLQKVAFSIPGLGSEAIQFAPRNNYNVGVSISQTVYDWGKDAAAIDKARTQDVLSQQNVELSTHQLAYQVAQAYFGIIYLQKAIAVQNAQEALIGETAKVIENRLKNGDEIDYSLVSTNVRHKNIRTRIVDLKNQLDKQYIMLSALIGKDVRAEIGSQNSFDWPSLVTPQDSTNIINNWDYKLSKTRELVSSKDITIAKAAKLPTFSFIGNTGFRNGFQPDIKEFRFNGGVGVKLSAPIYSGGRHQIQEDIARKNLQMSQYTTEATSVAIRSQLDQAESELRSSSEKLRLSETQLQEAQYALQLANARFQNGVITQLDVQSAQTALQEAEFQQIQFQYQRTLALLEVNRILGTKIW
ncbi:MAG: TolC family protein [Siphonobacter sp.]